MKIKSKYTRPDIPIHTTRLKRVFAWKPIYISGYWVWLQFYDVLQVMVEKEMQFSLDGAMKSMKVREWVDITKRL